MATTKTNLPDSYSDNEKNDPIAAHQLMAIAVTQRDELNVFIRLLTETLAGHGFRSDGEYMKEKGV